MSNNYWQRFSVLSAILHHKENPIKPITISIMHYWLLHESIVVIVIILPVRNGGCRNLHRTKTSYNSELAYGSDHIEL